MDIDAVIFDMDGLLFDTERLAMEGWVRAGREMGVPIREDDVRPMRGVTQRESRRIFRELYGEAFDYDGARKIRTQHAREKIDALGLPVKPGAGELLVFLRERDRATALATSSPREVAEDYLERAGFADSFDCMVCGEEAARSKPAPDVFLAAAGCLGVPPRHCLVLEDSPNGIRAAHGAGCPVIGVPDTVELTGEIAALCTAVCPDLHAVAELLRRAWAD